MPKRGENIYHRKDGRWEGRYKNGTNPQGKTKYSSVYGHSYKEVKGKLNKQKALSAPKSILCKYSFSEITFTWLANKKSTVKESSYDSAENIV